MIKNLVVEITCIQSLDTLHVVSFVLNTQTLTMMSLDVSDSIEIGKRVSLSIKPSSVAIAKNFEGELSYSNQLVAKIVCIENGELLSSIVLSVGGWEIESIITLASSKRMNLQVGDEVLALIQANEISIGQGLDD